VEQLEFWSDPVRKDAMEARHAARERWVAVRRRHTIGSPEELEAWRAYREAGDRVTAIIKAQGWP